MVDYRGILKHVLLGNASCNAIAAARGCSHNTVRRVKAIAHEQELTQTQLDQMSDTELHEMVLPSKRVAQKIPPNLEQDQQLLEKGYNRAETHARYMDEVGIENAVSYSAYCTQMREFLKSKELVFRHVHQPGYAMQIDFAGYAPIGEEDGTKKKFQLFVAVLPASHKLFAICTRSQSTSDHIEANIAALEYFGGAPETICPDNLKAAVTGRTRSGNPIINPVFLAFADYYNTRVTPARVRHPKDKAAVEVGVKLVQRLLRLKLNAMPRLNLGDINRTLFSVVEQLNARPMKRGGETREERFQRLDKPALIPLPKDRLQFLELPVDRRVSADHHIPYDRCNYSVPHRLIGKMVSVRASSKVVEIRHDGRTVAIHPRSFTADKFVTVDSHRPARHRAFIRQNFDDWKSTLHPDVEAVVDAEVSNQRRAGDRGELMARTRKLARDYGNDRLIAACGQARLNEALSLSHVKNLLINNRECQSSFDEADLPSITPKRNLRGSRYFQGDLREGGEA